MPKITVNIPEEILLYLNISESYFSNYAKKFLAIDLYKNKNISLGYCAELAEMTKEDFILFLGENKISIFGFENEKEFLEEVNNARNYSS